MRSTMQRERSVSVITIACGAVLALLAGCSSGGAGSGASPNGNNSVTPPPATPTPAASVETTPTAKVTEGAGNTVVATGNAVSQIGQQVKDANLPIVPDAAQNATGDVVMKAGDTVATLGVGVREGLGKIGSVDNPLGVTVGNTGNVVTQAGKTVVSAGGLVQSLGTEQLSPLAPVTQPVGGVVQTVGGTVMQVGGKLGDSLSTGPVAQLTSSASKAIVPLTTKLTDTTQTVGGATGLGVPVDNLLTKLGNTVATGGSMLTNANKPIVSPLGGVVTEAGKTVAAAGVLLNNRNGTAGGAGGNPLGGLLNGLPLAGAAGSGGGGGGAAGALAPVTGLVGSVTGALTHVTNAASGTATSGNAGSPLNGVTGLLGGLTQH